MRRKRSTCMHPVFPKKISRLKKKPAVRVKICGITNLSDALAAQSMKADALGFVFYPRSPRYIRPAYAKQIIGKLRKSIIKVGVFVNARKEKIKKILRECGLNMLQFHGHESPEFCANFKNYKIIKAFRLKNKRSLKNISRYKVDYYLFDAFKKGVIGGTGRKFNWGLLKEIKMDKPFFISGGLTPENVKTAIISHHPDWVDASSSLEEFPGKKNQRLLKKFIEKAKSYEYKS